MRSFVNNLRPWIIPVAFPALLFCVLTWIYLAPFGERTLTWQAGESSLLIGRPLPDARTETCVDEHGDCVLALDEPLYMSLTPPAGLWHEVRVVADVDLRDQEEFSLGLMQDFSQQTFALLPGFDATFSLEGVQKEAGAYKLILSLPDVEQIADKPHIHGVRVTFLRHTSVVGEIKWFIKGFWTDRP